MSARIEVALDRNDQLAAAIQSHRSVYWILPLASIVIVDWAIAKILALLLGHHETVAMLPWLILAGCIIAGLCLVGMTALIARMLFAREPHPLRRLAIVARQKRDSAAVTAATILLIVMALPAITAIKAMIPSINPFWADSMLARFDRALFLGNDPWRLTHALLGPAGTRSIDYIYASWFTVYVGTLCFLALTRNDRLRAQGLLTIFLSWAILGHLVATLFASVGPTMSHRFAGTDQFLPLVNRLFAVDAEHTLFAMRGLRFLISQYESGSLTIGAGISAMPSMHVAIAAIVVLLTRHTHWIWLSALYYAAILFGSVHLGWHYASDGLVSTIGVIAIWVAVGRCLDRYAPGNAAVGAVNAPL